MAIKHALLQGDRQTAGELAAILDLMAARDPETARRVLPGQKVQIPAQCAAYCREPA